MIKGKQRETLLKQIVSDLNTKWEVITDAYTSYPEHNAEYHMYIIKKISHEQ